ncbi:Signal transduction histidine kinase-related protein, C-terminal [Penicillium camemberti]|uniref:histidine kinase n=1 Tax=Penicillium camemberti (strain FM 013) TaxID=1429867 RepID=A0A0G4P9X9_PENC3|nr:Signal transduction histidine kinase-related protein, C-terminal [Penicillium camemberti]
MSSPSDIKENGDWTVIYDDRNEDDQNDRKEEKPSRRRQSLARTLSIPKTMCIMSDNKTEISTVAELLSPKLKLPQLGTDSAERIFPVRSVVSFDSTSSSALQTPSLDKLETPISPFSGIWNAGFANEQAGSQQKNSLGKSMDADDGVPKRPDSLVRLHQKSGGESEISPVLEGQSYASHNLNHLEQLKNIVQNGGEILDFHKTTKGIYYSHEDEEDIFIQSFGALIAMTESNGNFEVQVASDNSNEIIGHSPDTLFELPTFCDILPSSQQNNFLAHTQFVLSDDYSAEHSGPEVFFLSVLSSDGQTQGTWCTMHTSTVYKNYVICELQPEAQETNDHPHLENSESRTTTSDSRNLDMTSGAFLEDVRPPGESIDTRTSQVPDSSDSRSLDMTSGAFSEDVRPPGKDHYVRNSKVPDSSELLNTVPRILQRLANSQTLEALVQHAIATLQSLTQFDRTTMYHFDSDRNGTVLADAVDTSSGLTSYEGMHFLESTFPEASKKLYTRSTVCSSFSGSHGTSKLVYRASTNKRPLDMSNTYLSATPTLLTPHTDNPVKACLSIQVNVFGKLWGLISCQSYDSSQRLHPLVQKVCWFVAEAVSSNIERLSYTLPFQSREPDISLNKVNTHQAIKTPPGDLLSLFGADYAAASIMGESKILGRPIDSQEVLALFEYMKAKENDTLFWSGDITTDFQELNYSPGFHHLSGLLYVPLSADGRDFIIFFRADLESHNLASDSGRSSRQHEWSSAEFGKASVLSLLYRTFTDIWQEKEATLQNNQLMRLLLANSAHEFRTPLNAIINYLEIVLDGSLDQETRDHISRSHSASKSLVYIINDLLDLTNAENGQRLIKDETFDLSETLTEATDIFWEEARQKHVDLQVVQHAALPPVLGDQRRVRQVITNLISNAIQHTSTGAVTIETCIVPEPLESGHICVEVAIHDTGSGMSQETVETLFCELEQVSNKGYMQNPKSYECTSSGHVLETESVLGLGLALVARIVRNMNGQLSLKSEEGKGSCFKIRLSFPLPDEDSGQRQNLCTTSNEPPQEDERKQETKQDTTFSSCITSQKEDGIPCECGQSSEFESGQSIVNVDVSLKTGESRTLSLSGQQLEQNNQPDKRTTPLPKKDPNQSSEASNPLIKETLSISSTTKSPATQPNASPIMDWNLHVLVAEDDPTNSTIVQKRLEKFGHTVHMTSNGKECAYAYKANPTAFDAVLMDLQMPIVDGLGATQMIREYEQQELANETTPAPRIPIFAVSASLLEENREMYMESGFDGWVMKPIDFHRVDRLLGGVRLQWVREEVVYRPGVWEAGGWFEA